MEKDEKPGNKIIILILDKLIIALIILFCGWIFEKRMKVIENQLVTQREEHLIAIKSERELTLTKYSSELQNESNRLIELMRQNFQSEQLSQQSSLNIQFEKIKSKLDFSNEIGKIKMEKQINFIEKQLEEFYWPIYLRLEKNNAIYGSMGKQYVGITLDTAVILPNHIEIVKIIEEKIYLATPSEQLLATITKYVRHVKVYWALRKLGNTTSYPDDLGSQYDYPTEFYTLIKDETQILQAKYNELVMKYQNSLDEK